LLENWYNSKKGQVNALREKLACLKQNVNLSITVGIKEQLLSADQEWMLNLS
jgi:lysophospholipid acyltransferase (LPLAT)-like uncharacterized protein